MRSRWSIFDQFVVLESGVLQGAVYVLWGSTDGREAIVVFVLCVCVGGGGLRMGASESVLLIFRENRADFLRPRALVKLSILALLVVIPCNWLRSNTTWGSGFEFVRSTIVGEKRGEKCA